MLPAEPKQLVRPIFVAVLSLAGATLAVGYLQDVAGVPNPSSVYLIAVVLTALVAGTAGAVLASVASFLLYNFLFTAPRFSFSVTDPGVLLGVVVLLFVGIVVGQLAALERTRAAVATTREREARALFQLSRALATRDTTLAILPGIADLVRAETGMRRVWLALGSDDASERIVADTEATSRPVPAGLLWVLRRTPGDAPAEWIRVHQPSHSVSEIDTYRVRIAAGGTALGSIWAARDRMSGAPDRPATRLFAAAADQIGQAWAQDQLAGASRAAEVARQSDALKSSLLQSVSHDLRTPLAAIRMAVAGLGPESRLAPKARRESARAIEREVEHLNRLVTNLLDLSRIEAGGLRVETEIVELDDILARAIERLRPRLNGRALELELEAPAVRADPILLEAAFANVTDNAIAHTPPAARLRISAAVTDRAFVRLRVEDDGPGVSDADLPRIFEKFYRAPSRSSATSAAAGSGTGIGLAVAQGFVEAMGGRIAARRATLGGLEVDIDLPVASVPADVRR